MTQNIKSRLDQDIKTAMLAREQQKVTTLRGLKSAMLYAEVAEGSRQSGGLTDDKALAVLAKEAKKRQESADAYQQAGDQARADLELAEKAIIQDYLPQQLNDDELAKIVDQAVAQTGATDLKGLGQVIALVKQQTNGQADGGRIAAAVKKRLG